MPIYCFRCCQISSKTKSIEKREKWKQNKLLILFSYNSKEEKLKICSLYHTFFLSFKHTIIFLTTIGSSNDKPSINHFFCYHSQKGMFFLEKAGRLKWFFNWMDHCHHTFEVYPLYINFQNFWWVQYWFGEMKEYVAYH